MYVCMSMRENNARSGEWIGCRQLDEEEGGMKIKSNYLNAFHVANLSLSLSLHFIVMCLLSFFLSFFFVLFFSHFIFSVLFLAVRRPPIFRGRSFLSQNLEGMCYVYGGWKRIITCFRCKLLVIVRICVSNRKFSFAINKLLIKLRIIREKFYFNSTLRSFLLKNTYILLTVHFIKNSFLWKL